MSAHRGRPEDCPYVAWFDLETTGSAEDDRIMEVGFVLTDRNLNELESYSAVTRPPGYWEKYRPRMKPEVVEMHEKNGLLVDIMAGQYEHISDVDYKIADILKRYNGTNHVPFAGSGVAHFDRRFIKREMPLTDSHLSYWAYDIGSMRRFLKWWGLLPAQAEQHAAKTHRALDDIREHIAETRVIRDRLVKDFEDAWKYWELNR